MRSALDRGPLPVSRVFFCTARSTGLEPAKSLYFSGRKLGFSIDIDISSIYDFILDSKHFPPATPNRKRSARLRLLFQSRTPKAKFSLHFLFLRAPDFLILREKKNLLYS